MYRQYTPSLARWHSPDPLRGSPANPQSWNRYSYMAGNPVNGIDPNGALTVFLHVNQTFGCMGEQIGYEPPVGAELIRFGDTCVAFTGSGFTVVPCDAASSPFGIPLDLQGPSVYWYYYDDGLYQLVFDFLGTSVVMRLGLKAIEDLLELLAKLADLAQVLTSTGSNEELNECHRKCAREAALLTAACVGSGVLIGPESVPIVAKCLQLVVLPTAASCEGVCAVIGLPH